MRKLSELIVLVRGGGEVGSAIAHMLARSHFRICITETESPLAISRGVCFSEAVYETRKVVEDITGERSLPTLESIYKVWRNDYIPVVVDPEGSVKPLLKPDVLVNAMMLRRATNTRISDASLVIGIGPGFKAGEDVHLVIESSFGHNLGKVIIDGESEDDTGKSEKIKELESTGLVLAEDSGVFNTDKNIGNSVQADEVIGSLDGIEVKAPISGILRGILRNETKVLNNTELLEVVPESDQSVCYTIRDKMRTIAGGTLEAIMMSLNINELN
jgi:xanthine dehydrogenase accessory factor